MERSTEQPNLKLAHKLNRLAGLVTVAVMTLVVLMRWVKIDSAIDFSFLPPFHATLNAITAGVLIGALWQIKRHNIHAHRRLMLLATSTSAVFLLSYVTYHFTTEETAYCFYDWTRTIYFVLLISHVCLAAIIFPFILFTIIRGWTGQFEKHRKMARWVFPVWLYVAISGPILYLMLSPCYA